MWSWLMKLVMVLWVVLKFELHVCIKITEGSVCVCVWGPTSILSNCIAPCSNRKGDNPTLQPIAEEGIAERVAEMDTFQLPLTIRCPFTTFNYDYIP